MPDASHPPRPPTWYDSGLAFRCTACGDCCSGASGYVWVSADEAAALAAALGRPLAAFARDFLRTSRGRLSLRENAAGDCLLLDPASRRCRAYRARPRQCRTYPFWPAILATPDSWQRESGHCPGIGADTLISSAEIRALADGSVEGLDP